MLCDDVKCKMENQIESKRLMLSKAYENGILSDDTVKMSQELDKLILKCLHCKLSVKSLAPLELANIDGKHAMFLYYDLNHLSHNLSRYINHALKNNETIFMFIEPNWFDYIKKQNIFYTDVQYYPVGDLMRLFIEKGADLLCKTLEGISNEISSIGLNGVRIIGQPSYAIELFGEEVFLSFEKVLSKAFENLKASALCIYDFYDYKSGGKVINEKVIRDSFETHTNILNF